MSESSLSGTFVGSRQCDQIWPNFATLTKFKNTLAIFQGLFCFWHKYAPHFGGKFYLAKFSF